MTDTDTTARAIRQLREDLANARECQEDTVEVPTGALATVLAGLDIEWSPVATEEAFTTREAAEQAAVENFTEHGTAITSQAVQWRIAGEWHEVDEEIHQ